ncbi:AEX-3 domain-containing protein [Cantharellus anzutake]|uniref:AEX-3 domain-containing protein n=1 Tax=Cantharellus anzutake TaxID=1750568 RepID=UPI0019062F02|nr:AEX-3 domain-containing protein [Cantharellus anzutake]KAF8309866.1 AEX-3 domain-containing protein [Cantharellus anzutake]
MSVFRKPSLQVSPPDEPSFLPSAEKDQSWISRTLKRASSSNNQNPPAHDHLSARDLATRNASASSLSSLAVAGGADFQPPPTPRAPGTISSKHTPRSHRESTTSSAFLSVSPAHGPPNSSPTLPLASLYLVSGLPKSPQTWTLADTDSIQGVHHCEGAVGRFWRAEVLGSSVTPGLGGKKKRRGKGVGEDGTRRLGMLTKTDLGKMLSKSLKLSFTREVEIIASTLQPPSTVHTFTFQLPGSSDEPSTTSNGILRTSMLSTTTNGERSMHGNSPYLDPAFPRPSSTYLGPSNTFTSAAAASDASSSAITYYGVCLTVWSHADEDRSAAIRKTLEEAARHRKAGGKGSGGRRKKPNPWSATEAEDSELGSDIDGITGLAAPGENPGASTLFLPPNTVFWLPYALTLVSRHPIYDLMRDYLTLSWARFSKDVQSHTLCVAFLIPPWRNIHIPFQSDFQNIRVSCPRAGEMVKIDAGVAGETLEVVCRFPGGLDFGRGLVDVNFTMWPLFRCLNLDNILTICELALAPTGRILFLSRHLAMLGIAVCTIKYLCELRGWNGVSMPTVHARDAKIYLEACSNALDPGPWIIGMPTETRYITTILPEVCVCDLDINYVNCSAPPLGVVSVRAQRDKSRRTLMAAFNSYFHPDHSIPSEFKEAFPAGRFRPLCKITTKKGNTSTPVAEIIRAPDWWHQTRVVQAFDAVLRDKYKKPSLFKRLMMLGQVKPPSSLTPAERFIQSSIRKRASAFVDARDDLETKIGRLSRRLNFLMTESELWRQKFVSFEEYAEALSSEAAELRAKINKEQRESKRLSAQVTITSQEKEVLKQSRHLFRRPVEFRLLTSHSIAELAQTEAEHNQALIELERMREEMEEMERERSQMIAEVEAQIERALVSIAFSDGNSDLSDLVISRPGSAMSSHRSDSRPSSRNGGGPETGSSHNHTLRSFGTATTLAEEQAMALVESHPNGGESTVTIGPVREVTDKRSPTALSEKALRRFSVTKRDHSDALGGMDRSISERSDAVAQRMLQIQRKLDAVREAKYYRTESVSSARTSLEESGSQKGPVSRASRVRSPLLQRASSIKESPAETPIQSTPKLVQQEKPASPVNPSTPQPPIAPNVDTTPRMSVSLANGTKHIRGSASVSRKRVSVPPSSYAFTTDDSDDYQSALDHSTYESDGVDEDNGSPTQVVPEDYSKGVPGAYADETPRESLERGTKVLEEQHSQQNLKAGFLGTRARASSVATSAATERPRF